MLEKYLQEIGLNEKESAVYTALLQVDNDSVIDISKKTKINRSTTYLVLDSLSKKGLVSEVKLDKKVRFQAEPPERLETYIERQKIVLDERGKRLKDIIPQLKSVERATGERPVIKIYEGKDGIVGSFEEYFKTIPNNSVSYSIYSKDLVDQIFSPKVREKFLAIRVGKNVKSKAIYTKTGDTIPESALSSRIKIDDKKYPLFCDISICEDEVHISTLHGHLLGILIKNQDIAKTLKSLVEFILDHYKK